MRLQVEVRAVGDTFELAPAHGEQVLKIHAALGVVGQLVFLLLAHAQVVSPHTQIQVPLLALGDPHLVRRLVFAGPHEILDLHLFELARAESEVARRDLVAECLAHLGDAKGQLAPHGVEHVAEVDENALRSFGAQIDQSRLVSCVHRPDAGAKHQVERTSLGQVLRSALRASQFFRRDRGVDLSQAFRIASLLRRKDVVGARSGLARTAIGHRIREGGLVARVLPDQAIHEDGRIQPLHVISLMHD